jgi:hypothetical protein
MKAIWLCSDTKLAKFVKPLLHQDGVDLEVRVLSGVPATLSTSVFRFSEPAGIVIIDVAPKRPVEFSALLSVRELRVQCGSPALQILRAKLLLRSIWALMCVL